MVIYEHVHVQWKICSCCLAFLQNVSQYGRYGLSWSGHGTTLAHFDLDSTAVWLYSWLLLIFTNSTAFSQTTINLSQLISSIFCASLLFSLDISPFLSSILGNTEFPFLSHPSFLRAVLFPNLPRDQRCVTCRVQALMGCCQWLRQTDLLSWFLKINVLNLKI